MAKLIEVSRDQVKFVGFGVPSHHTIKFAEALHNFFHTLYKLAPTTGVEPYEALLVVEAKRVSVFCETSDSLSFAVDISTLDAFTRNLREKVEELLAQSI